MQIHRAQNLIIIMMTTACCSIMHASMLVIRRFCGVLLTEVSLEHLADTIIKNIIIIIISGGVKSRDNFIRFYVLFDLGYFGAIVVIQFIVSCNLCICWKPLFLGPSSGKICMCVREFGIPVQFHFTFYLLSWCWRVKIKFLIIVIFYCNKTLTA